MTMKSNVRFHCNGLNDSVRVSSMLSQSIGMRRTTLGPHLIAVDRADAIIIGNIFDVNFSSVYIFDPRAA